LTSAGKRLAPDTDNAVLLEHWTAELFGEHGTLVLIDHLL
jgi:hypothetical protein